MNIQFGKFITNQHNLQQSPVCQHYLKEKQKGEEVHSQDTKCQENDIRALFTLYTIYSTCILYAFFLYTFTICTILQAVFGSLLSHRANWEWTLAPLPVIMMCFCFKSRVWVFNKVSETGALFIVKAMKGSSLLAHSHCKPDKPSRLDDKCLLSFYLFALWAY